jgi:hypothetical protein
MYFEQLQAVSRLGCVNNIIHLQVKQANFKNDFEFFLNPCKSIKVYFY